MLNAWLLIWVSVVYPCYAAQFSRVQNFGLKKLQTFRGGNLANERNIQLSNLESKPRPLYENTLKYKTISRICLYGSVKDNDSGNKLTIRDETNVNISQQEGTNLERAINIQSMKMMLKYFTSEDSNVDTLCAFVTSPADDGFFETIGVLGYFMNKGEPLDTVNYKRTAAECSGCLSDFIILNLSSGEKNRLSEDETSSIFSSLLDGVERKIKSKMESSCTTILVKQKDITDQEDDFVISQLKTNLIDRKIPTDQCIVRVIKSHIDDNDLNHLLENIEENKQVPISIFPNLVQSMATALTNTSMSLLPNDDIVSFDQRIKVKMNINAAVKSLWEKDIETIKGNSSIKLQSSDKKPSGTALNSIDMNKSNNAELASELLHLTQKVMKIANANMVKIEGKQDDSLLSGNMPILEFGRDTSMVLEMAVDTFDSFVKPLKSSLSEKLIIEEKRKETLLAIAYGDGSGNLNLQTLFKNQLEALREFYGHKYETILDEKAQGEEVDVDGSAAQCVEGFKAAALHGIPKLCRIGQELYRDKADGVLPFEYASTLNGLLDDMMFGLESHKDAEETWSSAANDTLENGQDEENQKKKMTWYQKLGARLLVMGVNYGQGWLALQGIKRAAAERDKNMPKFPLF